MYLKYVDRKKLSGTPDTEMADANVTEMVNQYQVPFFLGLLATVLVLLTY